MRLASQIDALQASEKFFRMIGKHVAGRTAPGREIVYVPGNHDHHVAQRVRDLIAEKSLTNGGWAKPYARRPALPAIPERIEISNGGGDGDFDSYLSIFQEMTGPDVPFRICYPYLQIGDVWCTHGHYGDFHDPTMGQRVLSAMLGGLSLQERPAAWDVATYEAVCGPFDEFIFQAAQTPSGARNISSLWDNLSLILYGGGTLGRVASWFKKLWPRKAEERLREAVKLPFSVVSPSRYAEAAASIRAIQRVARELKADASYIVFGHTHRPISAAIPDTEKGRRPRIIFNCGSWLYRADRGDTVEYRRNFWPGAFVYIDGATNKPRLKEALAGFSHDDVMRIITRGGGAAGQESAPVSGGADGIRRDSGRQYPRRRRSRV